MLSKPVNVQERCSQGILLEYIKVDLLTVRCCLGMLLNGSILCQFTFWTGSLLYKLVVYKSRCDLLLFPAKPSCVRRLITPLLFRRTHCCLRHLMTKPCCCLLHLMTNSRCCPSFVVTKPHGCSRPLLTASDVVPVLF